MGEIFIKAMKQPEKGSVELDLEWFCRSLGLLGERDKNKTALKILKVLIKESGNPMTIEEISKKVEMSRTAVVHHITRMRRAGVVVKEGNKLELRTRSLQKLVDEIELDIIRTLKSIREVAEEIDSELNLPVRGKR